MCKPTVFQKTYEYYLNRLEGVDLEGVARILGGVFKNNEIVIPFFNESYRISSNGIFNSVGNTAEFSEAVVLSNYLLLCHREPVNNNKLVSYPEIKDASPLTRYFKDAAENVIAKYFANNFSSLKTGCERLKGIPCPDIDASYDLKLKFNPLPKIPIYLLFNDEAESFPAQCVLLFEKSGRDYLDPECLAILGSLLAGRLTQ